MSNHLRELLEEAPEDGVYDWLRREAPQAMCFDFGDYESLQGLSSAAMDSMDIQLPFPVVWVEVRIGPGLLGCLLVDGHGEQEGLVGVSAFVRDSNKEWKASFTATTDSSIRKMEVSPTSKPPADMCVQLLSVFRAGLCAMQCINISRVERVPPAKLQKARARRGKQPLFSYWTLEIDIGKSKAVGEGLGGTHASPRFHLRRGHPRRLQSGEYCWVQPHAVGSKKLGMVHKDYKLGAE